MCYIDSNIPKSIFYFALVDEFLRIARSSLYKDFNEKAMELLNRMKEQWHNLSCVEKHYLKSFKEILEEYCDEILSEHCI